MLHLMEFYHNFTYMLWSTTAGDNVYHMDTAHKLYSNRIATFLGYIQVFRPCSVTIGSYTLYSPPHVPRTTITINASQILIQLNSSWNGCICKA
jgi:hypothetical protein